MRSLVVEYGIADAEVTGSIPVVPYPFMLCLFRISLVRSGYLVFTQATRVQIPDAETETKQKT